MSKAVTRFDPGTGEIYYEGERFNSLGLSGERIDLLKRTYAKDTTDDEFALYMAICDRTGLDPFAKQIYCIVRRTRNQDGSWSKVAQTQVAIDGYRLIAERSGRYEGQLGPYWCGTDGKWVDIWLDDEPPIAARVGVLRKGFREPVWGVAKYKSFVQTVNGQPTSMWKSAPDNQLAKCAEAQAIRKAFPQELSGLGSHSVVLDADTREVMSEIGRAAFDEGRALNPGEAENADARAAWVERLVERSNEAEPIPPEQNPIFHGGVVPSTTQHEATGEEGVYRSTPEPADHAADSAVAASPDLTPSGATAGQRRQIKALAEALRKQPPTDDELTQTTEHDAGVLIEEWQSDLIAKERQGKKGTI